MKNEFCTNYDVMFENIVKFTRDYINNNKIKTLVLGMSGGIDSTLCAALAHEVVNGWSANVRLKGLVLPIESDDVEMARAVTAAKTFCGNIVVIKDMTHLYKVVDSTVTGHMRSDVEIRIRQGNIKARLRMIKLYDIAQKTNGLVLSTDNYTEYLLGFWTLHGDVGDYGMIQNLWKTEVYGLADYMLDKYKKNNDLYKAIALQECIKAMPTDGLGVSRSDFDQIHPDYDKKGAPVDVYGEIDAILLGYLKGDRNGDDHEVIRRHKATEFKRLNPFSIPREDIVG